MTDALQRLGSALADRYSMERELLPYAAVTPNSSPVPTTEANTDRPGDRLAPGLAEHEARIADEAIVKAYYESIA